MIQLKDFRDISCAECAGGAGLGFDFTMAYQPIVNTTTRQVFAYEALVRGVHNEPAYQVIAQVNDRNRYPFDQACRVKAIKVAAQLGAQSYISINFMPNAVYRPELCIRTTMEAADVYGFPIDRIIFEFIEREEITDYAHVRNIVEHYKQRGFKTALDDFGSGYANLNLLSEIQTDFIKLDMALVRGIDQDKRRQTIVKGTVRTCVELGIQVIAEGVETYEELATLQSFGIELIQGYYFAKPAFEALPLVPDSAYVAQPAG
jgi:EAL domain-containing protein (putative c-di-GMP-specific phosphodiesterase class I)